MKAIFALLVGLLVAMVAADSQYYYQSKVADKDFLIKQKKIWNLLYHIAQPDIVNQDLYDEGMKFDLAANIDYFAKEAEVKNFIEIYEKGMLPRGEIFSVFYDPLVREAMALFKLFYYANNFDMFYQTALWARAHVNEGQFACALFNAVLRRKDTEYIQLPMPYELYPYAFYNSEVMEKAHHAKVFGKIDKKAAPETYIIPSNYSSWYLHRDYDFESKLNYFTEDIGLASYYYFLRLDSPFFLSSKDYKLTTNRGAEYIYSHRQLYNRYILERLSNDLGKLEDFDWNYKFYSGYYPSLSYHNGLSVPQRPKWSNIPFYKYKYLQEIKDFETRLSAAIDSGNFLDADGKLVSIYSPDGMNILGNLLEGNEDSGHLKFYGSIDMIAKKILGFSIEPISKHQIAPSSLEMWSMSMRDPAFFRIYKRILGFYYKFMSHQKPYTKEEIVYPFIKIDSFSVDKMITYFDQFDSSISNGIFVSSQKEAENYQVKIRQYRLNHKPFTFHFNLVSEKSTKAVVRIFLGPKYDSFKKPIELERAAKYFYELDNFIVQLNEGANKLTRNSQECVFVIPDPEPSETVYKKLMKSIESSENFTYLPRVYGFPERLLIPKGKKEGLPLQLFIHVSPVEQTQEYYSRVFGGYNFDMRSMGYPLDKPLYYFPEGSNMLLKEVVIYHKDDIENLSF